MHPLWWIILVIIFLFLVLDCLPRLQPSYRIAKTIPGPKILNLFTAVPFIYSLTPAKCHVLPREWAKEYKQTYRLWAIGRLTIEAFKPSVMETILSSSKHTTKGGPYRILEPFLGEGLLISNGEMWLKRRRILTPAFHFGILHHFLTVFREECGKLRETLDNNIASGDGVVDLSYTMSNFTLKTICESAMGVKLDSVMDVGKYRRNLHDIGWLILERYIKFWLQIPLVYKWSLNRLRMNKLLKPVHDFTRQVIKKHRQKSALDNEVADIGSESHLTESIYMTERDDGLPRKRRFAMLDTLLAAESKGEITAAGIEAEVATFMFAGHDTTSLALTYIFLLLAHHPKVQQGVYEEMAQIQDQNEGAPLSQAAYNDMKYTERVIKECLRLYPPVPFVSRVLTEDINIETGQMVPKGTECHLYIFELHRDPEQFPDPETFDPDRFLPEEVHKRHPFAYLPFSCGPRNCIGQRFAMLELKMCLQEILMHFHVEKVTALEEVVLIGDIVLRSQDPIRVRMVRRE